MLKPKTTGGFRLTRGRLAAVASAALPIVAAAAAGWATTTAVAAGPNHTGEAAAILVPDGISVGGAQVVPPTGICDTGPQNFSGDQTTSADSFPCTLTTGTALDPLAEASVLTEQVTGAGTATSSTSQVANVVVGPGQGPNGSDVVDATVLNANAGADCNAAPTSSASIATLSVGGTEIIPSDQPQNTSITLPDIAVVTINYSTQGDNTATASALVVDFTGANNPLIGGVIFVSYAEADVEGCNGGPQPSPSATESPSANPSATPSATPSGSPSASPSGSPEASPSPCRTDGDSTDQTVEEIHESVMGECHENEHGGGGGGGGGGHGKPSPSPSCHGKPRPGRGDAVSNAEQTIEDTRENFQAECHERERHGNTSPSPSDSTSTHGKQHMAGFFDPQTPGGGLLAALAVLAIFVVAPLGARLTRRTRRSRRLAS